MHISPRKGHMSCTFHLEKGHMSCTFHLSRAQFVWEWIQLDSVHTICFVSVRALSFPPPPPLLCKALYWQIWNKLVADINARNSTLLDFIDYFDSMAAKRFYLVIINYPFSFRLKELFLFAGNKTWRVCLRIENWKNMIPSPFIKDTFK